MAEIGNDNRRGARSKEKLHPRGDRRIVSPRAGGERPAPLHSSSSSGGQPVEKFVIIVDCANEQEQLKLLRKFRNEGLTCKATCPARALRLISPATAGSRPGSAGCRLSERAPLYFSRALKARHRAEARLQVDEVAAVRVSGDAEFGEPVVRPSMAPCSAELFNPAPAQQPHFHALRQERIGSQRQHQQRPVQRRQLRETQQRPQR